MANRSAGESALAKHLRVLDAFDARHPFRTLAEIERATGLPHATAHRLVAELAREGLVEREPEGTYRLGIRLWEYASRTPGGLGLRELARPWMNAVHGRVRQHTQLGVRAGTDVVFVERMSAPDAVINATLIGGRLPMPISSSGIALLAHSPAEVVEEVVRAGWSRPTDAAVGGERELRALLRRTRANGYAVLDGHIHPESRGIAVPVLSHRGDAHAALSVVVPNDDVPPTGVIELLAVAAAGIARAIEDAYLPGGTTDGSPRVRPLISTSQRTLEYFASLGMTAPQ